jgi:crotonobetainyl-CoA:carnitine CoA-transferase CaiB-like acyl-CoA transferase
MLRHPPPLARRSGGTLTDPPIHPAALEGLRVLDLSRVLAGPLCTMILGDLGAEVIKVEHPEGGDDTRRWGPPWVEGPSGRESAYFLCCNRNKRSLTADLNVEGDRGRVRSLALEADVLIDNFARGRLRRWGLDHASLHAENPRLVTCSITGYGSAGAATGRPGYDFTVQARSGWMSVTGEPDGEPMKVGFALVDVLTGQNAAIAILASLQERERSGRGQHVEVALFDSAVAGLVNVAQASLTGSRARRYGNAHPTIVPYQAFQAADRPLVIAVGSDAQWRRFCTVLRRDELADDPRFAGNPQRVEHRDELVALLAARIRERTAAQWIRELDDAGVPCEPIRSVEEALGDAVLTERGGIWEMRGAEYGEVSTVASPLRLERTPPRVRRAAPSLGEHSEEIAARGWGG